MVASALLRRLGIFCGLGLTHLKDLTGGCYVLFVVLTPSLIIDGLGLLVRLLTLQRRIAAVVAALSVLTTAGCLDLYPSH
jgi:hypothetical protein